MNKQIDLLNLGGFPFEQNTLKFLQESYTGALGALAKLCGDKTILHGVEVNGSNVTAGWISYGGELIPFVGGSLASKVSIETIVDTAIFEDNITRDVYFTKYATCAAVGDFDFDELIPLLKLQNVWLPGDIRTCMRTNDYIAANFDGDGYGFNAEKGWRILSAAYPNAAGKKLVNRNPSDSDFNECGKQGGSKTHTLTPSEQGKVKWRVRSDDGDSQSGSTYKSIAGLEINGEEVVTQFGFSSNAWSDYKLSALDPTGTKPHNIVDPYFVVLHLIKI
ncbi:MAG TPA: hypothetical protein PKA85_06360 [Ferruginibacter sp.]|nr:hypothetical protein [Ferruginibacter sp.]